MNLLQYFIFDNKKYSHFKFNIDNLKDLMSLFPAVMRDSYVSDEAINRAMSSSKSPEEIINTYLPTKPHIKAGEFGEILSSNILLEKYLPVKLIGVKKWRFKPDKNKAAFFTDLVLYSCSDTPSKEDLLISAEVKTKSTDKNTNAIQDSVIGMEKDFVSRLGDTLAFLKDKYIQEGNAIAIKEIERFQQSPEDENGLYTKHYKAIVLIDSSLCDDEIKKEIIFKQKVENLEIIIICIEDLKTRYEQMYGRIPKSYKI